MAWSNVALLLGGGALFVALIWIVVYYTTKPIPGGSAQLSKDEPTWTYERKTTEQKDGGDVPHE